MKNYLRAFVERKAGDPGNSGDPITFVASTEGIKRDGKDLDASKWNLDSYHSNPVFLWAHDYMGRNLPIGRSSVDIQGKKLMATVTFDQADEFARQVEDKYRREFLNAVSVGWLDVARCAHCDYRLDRWSIYGLDYYRKKCPNCEREFKSEKDIKTEYDLLDISGVPVPGDPDALIEREYAALRSLVEERDGARPFPNEHACRLRDPGDFQEDSFRRVKREHEGKTYFVIMGRLKDEDAMTEQSFRYPKDTWTEASARSHCKSHDGKMFEPASSEGRWEEAAAEMARIFSPGPDDTDQDRIRAYRALLPAYRRLGKEAPEFRIIEELSALGEEEIRGLFLEGEENYLARAGAVLNARNRERLEQAQELIQEVLDSAKKETEEPERSAREMDGKEKAKMKKMKAMMQSMMDMMDGMMGDMEDGEEESGDDERSALEYLQTLNLRLQLP